MKTFLQISGCLVVATLLMLGFSGCDDDSGPSLTGDNTVYPLDGRSNPAISGNLTFSKQSDNSILVTIQLDGTQAGGNHPAHIHSDNAVDGGSIVLDLENVDGATGRSETIVTAFNDGTPVTYEELIEYDGHVNVHAAADNMSTLIAQGDIGVNVLTGESQTYPLASVSDPAIEGSVVFEERENGEAVATIMLDGTAAGNTHPAHIHNNSAAEGGGIAIDFNAVDGETGTSVTNIKALNDGTPITYDELLDFNGYVNVHLSSGDLGTLIAQGDIGGNELTGESVEYELGSVSDPAISGTATFAKRKSGSTLVTIQLAGTVDGNTHPSHIHNNSAAEGGGIAVDFKPIDGATGMSRTTIRKLNDATPVTYDDLIDFNGYINVHLSSDNLGTLVAQGDIGQNALTGDKVEYVLNSVSDPAISGTAMFAKRVNGTTLVTIQLEGTTAGGDHPAHIHNNSAAETGGIAIDLSNVNGATGRSVTQIAAKNDDTAITYDELIVYDGYINVHVSSGNLGTLIAQGDIGSNAE